MSKSVSNDALWQKLSEMDEKFNQYVKEQKSPVSVQKQVDLTPEIKATKDEIAELFKNGLQGLGTHCDSHFKTMYEHIEQLEKDIEGIYEILTCISYLLQEPKKQPETKQEPDKSYLNFKFFKLRKTSVVITILGLLVLTLTVFSMKQQNDYVLLNDEYYRQNIVIREMQSRADSLQNVMAKPVVKKKK